MTMHEHECAGSTAASAVLMVLHHDDVPWRKFKQDKGTSFEVDPKKLMMSYRLCIERYTVEKVVADALAEIATFKFQPETVPAKVRDHFLSFARSLPMKTKLIEILWAMTELLASTLAGATNRTIEEKSMRVELHLVRDSVLVLNKFAREEVDMSGYTVLSRDDAVVSTNLFFSRLHRCLVKGWRRALRESTPTTGITPM
jgi:hypothetical protein